MYSQQELAGAVRDGVISADEAERLRDFARARRGSTHVDDEDVRLIGGMDDAFCTIASIIALVGVGWVGGSFLGPFLGVPVAAAAWFLAEPFTLRRKLALTSRVLLGGFLVGLYFTGSMLAGPIANPGAALPARQFVGALFALAGAWFHWQRFRVPVTPAAAAWCGVALCLAVINSLFGSFAFSSKPALLTLLAGGVATFAWAMRWDMSDRTRTTRRADVAFWLHLMAAPLMVHPLFWLTGLAQGSASAAGGTIVIIAYVLLSLVSLAIDRRALLVSALIYVLWALGNMLHRSGSLMMTVAVTALIIGSGLLLLSAFWSHARRALVARLPADLRDVLPMVDRAETPGRA